MGIRPNRDGIIPPVTPDNPETRYSDWLTDLEDSGEIVGGVWQETDAKSTSGNNGVSDLAGRVAAMESTTTASGTGWTAHKRNGIVSLHINGANGDFTLPVDFSPITRTTTAIGAGAADHTARMRITVEGQVSFLGNYTYPIYAHVTFITG